MVGQSRGCGDLDEIAFFVAAYRPHAAADLNKSLRDLGKVRER